MSTCLHFGGIDAKVACREGLNPANFAAGWATAPCLGTGGYCCPRCRYPEGQLPRVPALPRPAERIRNRFDNPTVAEEPFISPEPRETPPPAPEPVAPATFLPKPVKSKKRPAEEPGRALF